MISRVKGTQDFLDLALFNMVIGLVKKHLERYHFSEIVTPIIEPLELFKRSLGVYTDVVSKEMFIIQSHQQSDEQICLRPEATAPIMRAFLNAHIEQTPWKVFSWGPMFRYERPQKGRFRQFHQVTMEIIGTSSIMQDVNAIKMLDRFFHEVLNLNNYAVLVNFLGCLQDRAAYREKLKNFLDTKSILICDTCKIRKEHNSMRIFDCKNPTCQEIYQKAPFIADNICVSCKKEWHELQEGLSLLSVSHQYAPTLVRGLDYYNKTVVEFVSDNLGAQNTFCGGGRYDQLAQMLGSQKNYPSFGVAIGIERLLLLLEPMRDSLKVPVLPALHVVMPLSAEQHMVALLITDMLQAHDLCVDILTEPDSIKSMMRQANKMGARYALIIGSEEQAQKVVTVKNMITGHQETVAQINLIEYCKRS